MISIEEAWALLDRQLEEGAAFAHMNSREEVSCRRFAWREGRRSASEAGAGERWCLRTLRAGAWGGITAPSFAALSAQEGRPAQLAAKAADGFRLRARSGAEIMMPKPVEHARAPAPAGDALPDPQDVALFVDEVAEGAALPLGAAYADRQVRDRFWDTEGGHGGREHAEASLEVTLPGDLRRRSPSRLQLFHIQDAATPLDLRDTGWQERLSAWKARIARETFLGPSPADLPWILSPHAFAQLIQATLLPVLAAKKPDPFHTNANPAYLEGRQLASPALTVHASPNVFSGAPFLDAEGVPARRVVLVEDGVLRRFVHSRLSAYHLGRSLSLHNDKPLAGSSVLDFERGTVSPAGLYLEVMPGAGLGPEAEDAHLFIDDLAVAALDRNGDTFALQAWDSELVKHGGQHRRHVPRLAFTASRNDLWRALVALGERLERACVPIVFPALSRPPLAAHVLPAACFRGFPCSWS